MHLHLKINSHVKFHAFCLMAYNICGDSGANKKCLYRNTLHTYNNQYANINFENGLGFPNIPK